MNQARITLKPGVEIIAIETENNDKYNFELLNSETRYGYVLTWDRPIPLAGGGMFIGDQKEDLLLLGRFTELSEEQCAMLVLNIYDEWSGWMFENYASQTPLYFMIASFSLKSALEAHNINPHKALIIKVNQ